jgi:hypothetical protein
MLMLVVVFPTPPFWLHMAMMRAGPCELSGFGFAKRESVAALFAFAMIPPEITMQPVV